MNQQIFHAILRELIDENPFACRALLRILEVVFTSEVKTLAVSCTAQPQLLVNLDFVREHCRNDYHVKAVLCHEFLHVLLRHTERNAPASLEEHLALDAVINAIIHRQLGENYSSFMSVFYAREAGVHRLLRCQRKDETTHRSIDKAFSGVWSGLYHGKFLADDIREFAHDLRDGRRSVTPRGGWLGNHDCQQDSGMSEAVSDALDRTLRAMNGDGIWRSQPGRGITAHAYSNRTTGTDQAIEHWRRSAWAVLRKHLLPDPEGAKTEFETVNSNLPVLSPGDRRSFARALWSPLIPEAAWQHPRRSQGATAQVYLDVSGSMNAEMPLIVALLARLGTHIRRPFWAFSNVVAPARIINNRLRADTTGGTSIACVLAHLARTRPQSAVIVTDGYIESVEPQWLSACAGIRLHVIVTRDGSPALLQRAGIPYTQLGRLPA